jgi:hypothetical protein
MTRMTMIILLERSSFGSASADGSTSQITQADESDAADIGLRTNERNSCGCERYCRTGKCFDSFVHLFFETSTVEFVKIQYSTALNVVNDAFRSSIAIDRFCCVRCDRNRNCRGRIPAMRRIQRRVLTGSQFSAAGLHWQY